MRLHPEGSVSGQVCQQKLEIFGNVLYVLGDFENPDSCIIEAVPDKDKLICEPMFSLMDEMDLLKENPLPRCRLVQRKGSILRNNEHCYLCCPICE